MYRILSKIQKLRRRIKASVYIRPFTVIKQRTVYYLGRRGWSGSVIYDYIIRKKQKIQQPSCRPSAPSRAYDRRRYEVAAVGADGAGRRGPSGVLLARLGPHQPDERRRRRRLRRRLQVDHPQCARHESPLRPREYTTRPHKATPPPPPPPPPQYIPRTPADAGTLNCF